jgi:NADH dehydrogenase
VEIRTGTQVASVSADEVELAGGEVIAAQTLVWAAGVKANPVAEALGLPVGRGGRVEVGRDLAVVGHPGVWAVGDIAAAGATGSGSTASAALPQLAPVAIQSGRHVGAQIARSLDGRPARSFRYRDKGTMATIGRGRAVAELPLGIKLRGLPAWMAWLALHLVFLAGFRNRISVFVNWAWNYLTWDRGPRLILTPDPADPEPGSTD